VDFLRTAPEAFLNLDTVGKAGEWVVELMGYKVPDDVSQEMLSQACTNDIAWTARRRTSSSSSHYPTHYEFGRNFLEGKMPSTVVFPVTRMLKIDKTRRLFTRETTNEENEKSDAVCCVVKTQHYQTPKPALAVQIEYERSVTAESVCQRTPPPNFNVPDRRPLVGDQGFSELTPAWFLYPPATPLTDIAAD
jgi:hypothetical protein